MARFRWLFLFGLLLLLIGVLTACADDADEADTADADDSADVGDEPGDDEEPAEPEEPDEDVEAALAEFYEDETITIYVGTSAGGSFDTFARILANHMGANIPGEPTIIVENMEGAGGLVAANHVYSAAPQDGTVIGHVNGGVLLQAILDIEGAEFDPEDTNWLGLGPGLNTNTCLVHASAEVDTLDDLLDGARSDDPLILGADNPGSLLYVMPTSLRQAYGLEDNVEVVSGYVGTAELLLAMEQEEVEGFCVGWDTVKTTALWDMYENDEIRILAYFVEPGSQPADFPDDVPAALELAPDEEAEQLVRHSMVLSGALLRLFMMPPEIPEARAVALQEAFITTLTDDEDAVAEFEEAGYGLDPVDGDELRSLIDEQVNMPDEVADELRGMLTSD